MKLNNTNEVISLDRTVYPLVVGNTSKFTFDDWETSGSTVQLRALVKHPTYTDEDVVWTSEDPEIAVVENGLVRGRTTGFTKIAASLPSGDVAVCHISVIDNITRSTVMYLNLNADTLTLAKGSGAVLTPIMYPEDVLGNGAMNREVAWESSNPSVVSVDELGKVEALSLGEAVITARSKDVGRTAVCRVVVSEEPIAVQGIAVPETAHYALTAGEQLQLNAEILGGESRLIWRSMNSFIADVDQNGLVTAYSNGKVDILVTVELGGYTERFTLEVQEPQAAVESVNINKKNINLVIGSTKHITATVSPACILDKQITWSSSNPEVVEVIEVEDTVYGAAQVSLKAVGVGTAVVTAASEGKTDSCAVAVSAAFVPVSRIELESELELALDQVYQLQAQVNSDAVEPLLGWLITDRNKATINQEGIVKGYQPGAVKAYAIALDSLTAEQKAVFDELKSARSIAGDAGLSERLQQLLAAENVTYSECAVTVQNSSPYLRNLHAPQEAVTDSSVNLLWNRASMLDAEGLSAYEVYRDGIMVAVTQKLGCTVKDLDPQTEYTFTVKAINSDLDELVNETITVKTKPAPTKVINVMDAPYNAVGNGRVMDTLAIQRAINDCPEGGKVVLPEGYVFYSGALFLKSNMTFQVDGILIGSTDPKDYPLMITRWEGWRKLEQPAEKWANSTSPHDHNVYAHASLINAGVYDEGDPGVMGPYNVSNLVICGKGQINGNGFKLGYNEGPNQKSGNGGKPVPESTKLNATVRGRTITLHNAENVYVADVNIAFSPSWTVHPIYCNQITFDNIELVSKGDGKTGAADDCTILNGDGIDPDSSTRINIFNCYFTAGDDAVAIKSGRNREGNELAKPTAYVRVTDCVSKDSKGAFCIGSEQAAGAHDILWQNLTVDTINLFGLWIKCNEARGGRMEDILWKDCRVTRSSGVIFMQLDYSSSRTNPADELPVISNMVFENIRGIGPNLTGIRFSGMEGSPIHDIVIRGCSFDEIVSNDPRAFWINYGRDFELIDVKLPEGFDWTITNAENIKK